MKKTKITLRLLGLMLFTGVVTQAKETVAVVNFDITGTTYKEAQYISMTSAEIRKLDSLEVMDKYSVEEVVKAHIAEDQKCFGVACLSEIGRKLDADLIVTGSAEVTSDKLSLHLRLIDPKKKEVVKSSYSEYIYDGDYIYKIMEMSVRRLFGNSVRKEDAAVYDYALAKKAELEGPRIKHYDLSGPRFGGSYMTGDNGHILSSQSEYGFAKSQYMTVIGYQYEKSYLYTGALQAVMQLNFSLTGLDQQMAIPSFSFLNGFRTAKHGFEFGFGPVFRFKKLAKGYKNSIGDWKLQSERWEDPHYNGQRILSRLDTRGNYFLTPGWVWAVGKSFKAGNMTIPVNAYAIPDRDGWLFGLSVGYALHKG